MLSSGTVLSEELKKVIGLQDCNHTNKAGVEQHQNQKLQPHEGIQTETIMHRNLENRRQNLTTLRVCNKQPKAQPTLEGSIRQRKPRAMHQHTSMNIHVQT